MKMWNPFKRKKADDGMQECYEARRASTADKLTSAQRVMEKMDEIRNRYERRHEIVTISFTERRNGN